MTLINLIYIIIYVIIYIEIRNEVLNMTINIDEINKKALEEFDE